MCRKQFEQMRSELPRHLEVALHDGLVTSSLSQGTHGEPFWLCFARAVKQSFRELVVHAYAMGHVQCAFQTCCLLTQDTSPKLHMQAPVAE